MKYNKLKKETRNRICKVLITSEESELEVKKLREAIEKTIAKTDNNVTKLLGGLGCGCDDEIFDCNNEALENRQWLEIVSEHLRIAGNSFNAAVWHSERAREELGKETTNWNRLAADIEAIGWMSDFGVKHTKAASARKREEASKA